MWKALTMHAGGAPQIPNKKPIQSLSGLKLFGSFILWSIPVLAYIYGLRVSKTILDILREGIIDETALPEVWQSFSAPQLELLIEHLITAVPALAIYHMASFFRFPLSSILPKGSTWYLNADAICNMIAAPLFAVSMVTAFKSLFNIAAEFQLASFLFSAILGLLTIPLIPWVVWEIEYSGRKLKGNLEDFFLPKWFLGINSKLNVYRFPAFVHFVKGLFDNKVGRSVLSVDFVQCYVHCIDSLVDAGIYSDPNIVPMEPLTEKKYKTMTIGILWNMLYGILVGINLLTPLTHFGFYTRISPSVFAKSGGCPYAVLYEPRMMVKVPGLLLGTVFLFLLLVCQTVGVVVGLSIMSSYGAFNE
jgi:tetrahydromethanopterin S-methyltransferase subunit B